MKNTKQNTDRTEHNLKLLTSTIRIPALVVVHNLDYIRLGYIHNFYSSPLLPHQGQVQDQVQNQVQDQVQNQVQDQVQNQVWVLNLITPHQKSNKPTTMHIRLSDAKITLPQFHAKKEACNLFYNYIAYPPYLTTSKK